MISRIHDEVTLHKGASAHAEYVFWSGRVVDPVYEYDPADDGPEAEAITRILASHALYAPGKEGELLKFQHFVDDAARALFNKRYGRLGKKRQETVRKFVIHLHVDGRGAV